jgi:hypothetical protein
MVTMPLFASDLHHKFNDDDAPCFALYFIGVPNENGLLSICHVTAWITSGAIIAVITKIATDFFMQCSPFLKGRLNDYIRLKNLNKINTLDY